MTWESIEAYSWSNSKIIQKSNCNKDHTQKGLGFKISYNTNKYIKKEVKYLSTINNKFSTINTKNTQTYEKGNSSILGTN